MAIADRKEREKEERRKQIITAAEHLFFRYGYDQVSMDQIARDAELSKGTLFFYFKNKEALFIAIILRGITLFHQTVEDGLKDAGLLSYDRLSAMGRAVVRFSREYPGYLALIRLYKSGRFSRETGIPPGEEETEILRHAAALMETMEGIVREGAANGTFRDDIDPRELALMIRMMTGSAMDISPEIRWAFDMYTIDEESFIQRYLDLIGSMVKKPGIN